MTVKELIEELKKLPENDTIEIYDRYEDQRYGIDYIDKHIRENIWFINFSEIIN